MAIMMLVHGYFTKTRKAHTLMSQAWMLEHLQRWHGLKISRSTLNYNLAILRRQGMIDTVTRHKRERNGEFVCQVTLYKMTKGLRRFFGSLALYFRRCDWVPPLKALAAGIVPAVGAVQSRVDAAAQYWRGLREERDRGRRRRKR